MAVTSGLKLNGKLTIPEEELEFKAIRAQGAGGQHVNKTSTAIHLRFDIHRSSLPEFYKSRLLGCRDQRISSDGVIVIKAQRYRSREQNRQEALERLREIVENATRLRKKRKPTQPTQGSRTRRLDRKSQRGRTKTLRKKPTV